MSENHDRRNQSTRCKVSRPGQSGHALRCPFTQKQVQRSTGATKKRDAEKAAGKWESELREGRYKTRNRMTWEEFILNYHDEKLASLAEATGEAADSAFNHATRTIKPERLSDLTTARLADMQLILRREGMRETTIATHLRQLRVALSWAVRRGYLRTMPIIEMPQRAKGVTQVMRGRAVTGEEMDRMIEKVPSERKREPEKWQQLPRGLNLSGLRLGEALALSWDDDSTISVCMAGRYPALRIFAESQKNHQDKLLPIAPEFVEFLLATPKAERHGLVFGIYGVGDRSISTKRASRYISAIGKAAKVVTNKSESRFATAHDLRRSFGTRWARKLTPAILRDLMRHSCVETTMKDYIDQSAEDVGDVLRTALSTNGAGGSAVAGVDIDANCVKITG